MYIGHKKVLGNIRYIHGLMLGSVVGSGLVPSSCPFIVITIVHTMYMQNRLQCKHTVQSE